MIFCFRALTISGRYSAITIDIPVLEMSAKHTAKFRDASTKRVQISERSPIVVLTTTAFYVGSLKSMSREFMDTENKFIVRHDNGAPQMTGLLEVIKKWEFQNPVPENERVFIVVPEGEVPYPVVAQVVDMMKRQMPNDRFVLSTGIL
jgi:hypothetical protein